MEFKNYTYLLLILGLLAIPLSFTFNNRICFYAKLEISFPCNLLFRCHFSFVGYPFYRIENMEFYTGYLTGIYIYGVPMEEWLFYFAVPYSAVFLYETLVVKFPDFEKPNLFLAISLVLFVAFGLIAYFARQRFILFYLFSADNLFWLYHLQKPV